jgi:hypothetical protein
MLTRLQWVILILPYISHHKLNRFYHINLLRLVQVWSIHLFLCLPRLSSVLQFIRYSIMFGNIFHTCIICNLVTQHHRLLLETHLALLKLNEIQD